MDNRGSGWIAYAGIMLIIGGIMRFFDSIWAFSYHGTLPSAFQGSLYGNDLKRYAWIWLVVAIVLFLSGLGVFTGNQLARWIGVVAGAIMAITSIWWMPYYPIWSLTYIVLGSLVVYGLVAYGSRDAELTA
jgi:hypothetical protein